MCHDTVQSVSVRDLFLRVDGPNQILKDDIALETSKMTNSPLSSLFTFYGSDKNTDHSYGPFYDELANTLLAKDKPLHIMEIGVQHGFSVNALHAHFQDRATIYGVDLNVDSIKTLSTVVKGLVADQSSRESLQELCSRLYSEQVTFDLIIDDASHAKEDQLRSVEALWPLLAPAGYYVIEDVQQPETVELFSHFLGFRFVDLRNIKNRCDDMLVVMQKPD